MNTLIPKLTRLEESNVAYWTDVRLFETIGVRIAFSERNGGVSAEPFSSLNLGLHVGDDLEKVWENRRRLLQAVGIGPERLDYVASAHQTHSKNVAHVRSENVGGRITFDDVDAFICGERDIPLLLCYADCAPVILVNTKAPYSISVVHSGWKGTLLDVVGEALDAMVNDLHVDPREVVAYIGPFVCAEHLILPLREGMKFFDKYETIAPANWEAEKAELNEAALNLPVHIDMEKAIRESLTKRGVRSCDIVSLGACSAERTSEFFSYRAEDGNTGRHGALAMLTRVS